MTLSSDRIGMAFVICAPSGTGKTTLIQRLVAEHPGFAFSTSCTTRKPRNGEVNGKDYHFLEPDDFKKKIEQGFFAEWAEVHGNYYGTPVKSAEDLLHSGRDVLFDVDVQGAAQLKQALPSANFIFILPPSREELEKRLRGRGSETDESIQKRLFNAGFELREAHWFDYWIVNDDIERAWAELKAVYMASALKPGCRRNLLDDLRRQWSEAGG